MLSVGAETTTTLFGSAAAHKAEQNGHVLDVSHNAVRRDDTPPRSRAGHASDDDADARDPDAPTSGYVAHVALDRASLDVEGHERALAFGMEVTAEIKTGRRRVIGYLLSPVRRYAHDGFGER